MPNKISEHALSGQIKQIQSSALPYIYSFVAKQEGGIMHFDVIVPDDTAPETVISFGKAYLQSKGQANQPINSKNCLFCHIESPSETIRAGIQEKGYYTR